MREDFRTSSDSCPRCLEEHCFPRAISRKSKQMPSIAKFLVSPQPIHAEALHRELVTPDHGGIVTFEGRVRNHHLGRGVVRLEYVAYRELAEREGLRVMEEVCARHEVNGLAIHAIGSLQPGELAIWIGVAAGHRGEAFVACREMIDSIKARVPIWKHEFYSDGADEWVDPTTCCQPATDRQHAH
jgi:molybdopterin synthase catalytic subunit